MSRREADGYLIGEVRWNPSFGQDVGKVERDPSLQSPFTHRVPYFSQVDEQRPQFANLLAHTQR